MIQAYICIVGFIPPHGQYEGTREGFIYEPDHDRWQCRQGKYVNFKSVKYQKNHREKLYRTTRADCKGCPLATECIGRSHEKHIRITVYKQEYDRALIRSKTKKAKYYKTLRQSTVEPVLGSLINFTGMRKINTRGIESANKVMLMAAIAYNLKKLLKHNAGRRCVKILSGIVRAYNVLILYLKKTISAGIEAFLVKMKHGEMKYAIIGSN